jgi:hypothetical protein
MAENDRNKCNYEYIKCNSNNYTFLFYIPIHIKLSYCINIVDSVNSKLNGRKKSSNYLKILSFQLKFQNMYFF